MTIHFDEEKQKQVKRLAKLLNKSYEPSQLYHWSVYDTARWLIDHGVTVKEKDNESKM